MFSIRIYNDSAKTYYVAASANAFALSDPIVLTKKWYDNKNISLKIDFQGSVTSGQLEVYPVISASSGGTYTPILTGSGSSMLWTKTGVSLTVTGGEAGNGSYFIPLTVVQAPGSTIPLKGIPFMKIGTRADHESVTTEMHLIIG